MSATCWWTRSARLPASGSRRPSPAGTGRAGKTGMGSLLPLATGTRGNANGPIHDIVRSDGDQSWIRISFRDAAIGDGAPLTASLMSSSTNWALLPCRDVLVAALVGD